MTRRYLLLLVVCSAPALCSDLLLLRVGGISNGGPSWPPGTPKIAFAERAIGCAQIVWKIHRAIPSLDRERLPPITQRRTLSATRIGAFYDSEQRGAP